MTRKNDKSQNVARAERPNITLNIQVPDVTAVGRMAKALPWKKIGRTVIIIAGVAVAVYGSFTYIMARQHAAAREAAIKAQTIPSYQPLTTTLNGDQTAGAQYIASKQLYVFHDAYHQIGLTISQQPLPQSNKTPEEKLADIALSLGATEKLPTSLGSVYFTQPDNGGGQRAIFTNKQVLVIASSDAAMTSHDWGTYVQSLR